MMRSFPFYFWHTWKLCQEYETNILRISLMRKMALESYWLHKNWTDESQLSLRFLLVFFFLLFTLLWECVSGWIHWTEQKPVGFTVSWNYFYTWAFLESSYYLSKEFSFLPLTFLLSSDKTILQGKRKMFFLSQYRSDIGINRLWWKYFHWTGQNRMQ